MNQKKKCKELKRISRENLNGQYQTAMGVFLSVILINILTDLPFSYLLGNVYATTTQTIIYYIAEVLLSIVVGVLQMGLIRFHICMAKNSRHTSLMCSTVSDIVPTDILVLTSSIMLSQ